MGNLTEDFKVHKCGITGILVNVDGRNCFQKKKKISISWYNFGESNFLLIQLEIHDFKNYFLKTKERYEI